MNQGTRDANEGIYRRSVLAKLDTICERLEHTSLADDPAAVERAAWLIEQFVNMVDPWPYGYDELARRVLRAAEEDR